MSSATEYPQPASGLRPETADTLARFRRRRRHLLGARAVAAGLICFITATAIIVLLDLLWLLPDPARWMISTLAYVIAGGCMWWFGLREMASDDPRHMARLLESADPRLREDLLSAVELADPDEANGSLRFRRRLQAGIARRTADLDVG